MDVSDDEGKCWCGDVLTRSITLSPFRRFCVLASHAGLGAVVAMAVL